jgi:L-alanine-DL-glutamate epimerase-like enolase superfamily enzyme
MAGTLALGHRALALRLLLVASGQTAPISQVEWVVYDTGMRDPADEPVHRCAVRITTTAGTQGWADFEGWTAPDAQAAQLIRDILLGQDPAGHENLWQQLYQHGLPLATLGAVDVALWDLRGRIEGEPVHVLLSAKRQKVKSYVSTGLNLGDPAAYAEFAVACQTKGIHGVKVRPGGSSPENDIAVYSAVRQAVGPEFTCIAGGAATYTSEQALSVGRVLDELGYAWYQSPMPENDEWVGRYVTLAGELETSVCAPETDPGSYESRVTWLERGACDIPCIDVHHGGLTACVQLALACESRGAPLELRNVGPDAYAHLPLAGASDESLLTHIELLSSSQETSTLPGRATPELVCDEQGYVAIRQAAGMGLELDWKYIFTHRVG